MNKQRVMKFIKLNFDLSAWELEDFPNLPGGTLLISQHGGSVLIWTDLLDNSIHYSINGEKAVKVARPFYKGFEKGDKLK